MESLDLSDVLVFCELVIILEVQVIDIYHLSMLSNTEYSCHRFQLVRGIQRPGSRSEYVGVSWNCDWWPAFDRACDCLQWSSWSKVSYVSLCLSSHSGKVLMISSGYPILNRASFGVFGAWWPTFNRAMMAIVWNGVNAVQEASVFMSCCTLSLHTSPIYPMSWERDQLWIPVE